MVRVAVSFVVALCAVSVQAATLSLSGPASGLTHVVVDQPFGQFTKVGLPGSALQSWSNDAFWTDSPQVWITDHLGVGSLHSLDLTPDVSLIAVRPSYVPEGDVQEFAYEYQAGALRHQVGPLSLPLVAASVAAIPEPTAALLAAFGLLCVALRR